MTLQEITSGATPNKRTQRKGRGRSSNRGKTSGRGGKGSSARQGSPHWVPGHEGGQTRIFKRFPKRGFSNTAFAPRFHVVTLTDVAEQLTTVPSLTPPRFTRRAWSRTSSCR